MKIGGKTELKNKKNSIFAISVAAAAIPPKPKAAAIIAMIKKVIAQLNMIISLSSYTFNYSTLFILG